MLGSHTEKVQLITNPISPFPLSIPKNYTFHSTLNSGSSGTVSLIIHPTLPPIAIKQLYNSLNDYLKKRSKELYIIREAFYLSIFNHPNLNKLNFIGIDATGISLGVQYCPGRDLVNFKSSQKDVKCLFRQMLSGVDYMHRNGVVHRDIKLDNMMVDGFGNLTIVDFGLAKYYDFRSCENSDHFKFAPKLLLSNCGSACYASPEILFNSPYQGPECDAWSLGVCLFALCTGYLPFDDDTFEGVSRKVLDGIIEYPEYLDDNLVDLIQKILIKDNRLSISEMKAHKWVDCNEYEMGTDVSMYFGMDMRQMVKHLRENVMFYGDGEFLIETDERLGICVIPIIEEISNESTKLMKKVKSTSVSGFVGSLWAFIVSCLP